MVWAAVPPNHSAVIDELQDVGSINGSNIVQKLHLVKSNDDLPQVAIVDEPVPAPAGSHGMPTAQPIPL